MLWIVIFTSLRSYIFYSKSISLSVQNYELWDLLLASINGKMSQIQNISLTPMDQIKTQIMDSGS